MNIEQTIRNYIEPLQHLSLGTSANNIPWVCEVHYAYDEQLNLYFRSKPSRRHSEDIATNPRVAGNIIKTHGPAEVPAGVYFEGTAKLLRPGPEMELADAVIRARLSPPGDLIAEAKTEDGHQFYKVTVSNYYFFGRIDSGPVSKNLLSWNGGARAEH